MNFQKLARIANALYLDRFANDMPADTLRRFRAGEWPTVEVIDDAEEAGEISLGERDALTDVLD